MPKAKVIVLTEWGVMPTRVAYSMFSEAARTALPRRVFFRKKVTAAVPTSAMHEGHEPDEGDIHAEKGQGVGRVARLNGPRIAGKE